MVTPIRGSMWKKYLENYLNTKFEMFVEVQVSSDSNSQEPPWSTKRGDCDPSKDSIWKNQRLFEISMKISKYV